MARPSSIQRKINSPSLPSLFLSIFLCSKIPRTGEQILFLHPSALSESGKSRARTTSEKIGENVKRAENPIELEAERASKGKKRGTFTLEDDIFFTVLYVVQLRKGQDSVIHSHIRKCIAVCRKRSRCSAE